MKNIQKPPNTKPPLASAPFASMSIPPFLILLSLPAPAMSYYNMKITCYKLLY